MARVPASKQTRKRLVQFFNGSERAGVNRSELVKPAARLIVEEALEEDTQSRRQSRLALRFGPSSTRQIGKQPYCK